MPLDRDTILRRIAGADYRASRAPEAAFVPATLNTPLVLTSEQKEAVDAIVRWRTNLTGPRFFSLQGPAGSGKSTIMRAVGERLAGTRTAWSAMTGKAASRLREASGVDGKTFHSVVYDTPREVDNTREQRIDLEFDGVRSGNTGSVTLLIIDESSMIGPKIRFDTERSPYDKILFVGDPYQIPPILSKREEEENGSDYSVFTGIDGPCLTRVMRAQGAVLDAATFVRERQEIPEESATDGGSAYTYEVAVSRNEAIGQAVTAYLEDREDHALITWTNEKRMLANLIIREQLGYTDPLPQEGEPLIIRKNIYRRDMYSTPLMNGDVVRVEEWMDVGPTLAGVETRWLRAKVLNGNSQVILVAVAAEGKPAFEGVLPYVGLDRWKRAIADEGCDEPLPVTWGYTLTCHLAQGSEYRRVTTFLPGNDLANPHFRKMTKLPDGTDMRFMHRFLYTSLSRAKQHTSLIISR